jgi:hypothetical protein
MKVGGTFLTLAVLPVLLLLLVVAVVRTLRVAPEQFVWAISEVPAERLPIHTPWAHQPHHGHTVTP